MKFLGFSLRLTRLGGVFLAVVLVVGGAAVNTGNNALMLLLAVGLGSYAVSGVWSRQVLGQVEVLVRPPGEVFAGSNVPVEVEVRNGSRVFPAYGLALRDGDGRVLLMEPRIGTGRSIRRVVRVRFERRGRRVLGPWRAEVLLPLGFFVKSKRVVNAHPVLVYPKILRHARSTPRRSVSGTTRGGSLGGRGREGDVLQLRAFREGDENRQVHWKQTARQERLIVMERQRWTAEPAVLVLDPRIADPSDSAELEQFETLVSRVATDAMRLLRAGRVVGLRIGSKTVVRAVEGVSRRAALLAPLAEVEPVPRGTAVFGERSRSQARLAVDGGRA